LDERLLRECLPPKPTNSSDKGNRNDNLFRFGEKLRNRYGAIDDSMLSPIKENATTTIVPPKPDVNISASDYKYCWKVEQELNKQADSKNDFVVKLWPH